MPPRTPGLCIHSPQTLPWSLRSPCTSSNVSTRLPLWSLSPGRSLYLENWDPQRPRRSQLLQVSAQTLPSMTYLNTCEIALNSRKAAADQGVHWTTSTTPPTYRPRTTGPRGPSITKASQRRRELAARTAWAAVPPQRGAGSPAGGVKHSARLSEMHDISVLGMPL